MSYIEETLVGLAERERKAHKAYYEASQSARFGRRREALRQAWYQIRRHAGAAMTALRERGGPEEAQEVRRIWRALRQHRENIHH